MYVATKARPLWGLGEFDSLSPGEWTKRLRSAVEAGWSTVELPAGVADAVLEDARRCQTEVGALRLTVGNDGAFLAAAAAEARAAAFEATTAAINRAGQCGAAVLTVQPAAPRTGEATVRLPEYADALQWTKAALKPLARPAALADVVLGVEVAAGGFLLSPAEARDLLDRVCAPNVGACLDLSRIARISHWPDWIATLRHRIACVRTPADHPALDQLADALNEIRYVGPVVFTGTLVNNTSVAR